MKRLCFCSLALACVLYGSESDEYVEIVQESTKDEATLVVDIPKGKITSSGEYREVYNGVGILFKDLGVDTDTQICGELRVENPQREEGVVGMKITGGNHHVVGSSDGGFRLMGFNTIDSYLFHSSGGNVVFENLFIVDKEQGYITTPKAYIYFYESEKVYIGGGGRMRFEGARVYGGLLSDPITYTIGQSEFELNNGTLSFGEISSSYSVWGIGSANGYSNAFTLKNNSLIEFDSLQGFSATGFVSEDKSSQNYTLNNSTIHFKDISNSKYAIGLGAGREGDLAFDLIGSSVRFDSIIGDKQSFGIYISNDETTHNRNNRVYFSLVDSTLSFGTIGSLGSMSIGMGIEQNAQGSYIGFSGWGIVSIDKMRGVNQNVGVEPYGSYVMLALGGKIESRMVRIYYGDYQDFDSSGKRAMLYANFGSDADESFRLKYDFASGLLMTSDASFYESGYANTYSRFLLTPQNDTLYLMHFSSLTNPHAISLNAKEFAVKNFSHPNGDVVGARLEGKIFVDFMAPKPYFSSDSKIVGRDVYGLSIGAGEVNFTGYQAVSLDYGSRREGRVMYNLSLEGSEIAYGIYLNPKGESLRLALYDSLSQSTISAPLSYSFYATGGDIDLYGGSVFLSPKEVQSEDYYTFYNRDANLTISANLINSTTELLPSTKPYTLQDDLGGRYFFGSGSTTRFVNAFYDAGILYFGGDSNFLISNQAKIILDGGGEKARAIVLGENANPHFAMGEESWFILQDNEGIKVEYGVFDTTSTLHFSNGSFVFKNSDSSAHTLSSPHISLRFENTNLYLGEGYEDFHRSQKSAGIFFQSTSKIIIEGKYVNNSEMLITTDKEIFSQGSENTKILLTPKDGELYGIYTQGSEGELSIMRTDLKFQNFYQPSYKNYLLYNPNSKLSFYHSSLVYGKDRANALIDIEMNGESLYLNVGNSLYIDYCPNGTTPDGNGTSFINGGGLQHLMRFGGSGSVSFEGGGVIDAIYSGEGGLGYDREVIAIEDVAVDFNTYQLNIGENAKGVSASIGMFENSTLSLGRETHFDSSNKDYALYAQAYERIKLDGTLRFQSSTQTGGIGGSGVIRMIASDGSELFWGVSGKPLVEELYTLGNLASLEGVGAMDRIKVDFDSSSREHFKLLEIGREGERGLGVGKYEFVMRYDGDVEGVQIAEGLVQRSDMLLIYTHQGQALSPIEGVLSIQNTSANSRQGDKTLLAYVKDSTQEVLLPSMEVEYEDKVMFNGLKNGESIYTQGESKSKIFSTQTKITRYDYNGDSYYVGESMVEKEIQEDFAKSSQQTLLAPSSLYLVNLNSLSKRMGELRWGGESESGVWGRVFGGEFLQGESIAYATIQAGYDYVSYMSEGAKNFTGAYLSYSYGVGESNGFEKVQNNAVEVGVYNSFIQEGGWYNDSILKASFYLTDTTYAPTQEDSSMQNYALALSSEVGYSYEIAGVSITPQYEGSVAYFSSGKMNLSEIEITQEGLVVVRNRVGVSWGYDFSSLMKGNRANIYVGTYFVYDYFSGGDSVMWDRQSLSQRQEFHNKDMRFALNIGSNFKLKDSLSLYLNFEKNFGGKLNVNYQVNFGMRYELGEKTLSKKEEVGVR
ncbi:autotransporter outer membrane beta-barrel domain-containing protein [Helicobacter brantae]|uniref:Autotransporter domain-containing protein n=1 Tax=Helicobacter brantae TaxID=375927 RepID=A0A3D8IZB1_9HELI|nr:autotransporter outer membrane beta-barrel domain-containing protein [Helicobacter brantae]RDU70290.1 hypothetical protein CQA58_06085 [Helicobacter brantae]